MLQNTRTWPAPPAKAVETLGLPPPNSLTSCTCRVLHRLHFQHPWLFPVSCARRGSHGMWHFEQSGSLGVGNEGATAIAGPPARLWQGDIDECVSSSVDVLGCDAGGSGASSGGCCAAFLSRVAEARRGLLPATLPLPPFSGCESSVASLLAGGVAANAAPPSSVSGTSSVSIEGDWSKSWKASRARNRTHS